MDSLFQKLLKKKIEENLESRSIALTQTGVSSFDEYKYYLGYMASHREVLELIEETLSDMRKDA